MGYVRRDIIWPFTLFRGNCIFAPP